MDTQQNHPAPNDPPGTPEPASSRFANRPYQVALTVAVILFIVTLTISILVLIISREESQDREQAFDMTLTAIYADVSQTQAALADRLRTPPDVPPPVYREYPFALAPDSPRYAAAATCSEQVIDGTVRDMDGQPTDALNITVWGDYLDAQTVPTGELAGQDAGRWRVTLSGPANRRVFVQLHAAGRYLSAPVELVFDATDCARNRATVDFVQIAPLQ